MTTYFDMVANQVENALPNPLSADLGKIFGIFGNANNAVGSTAKMELASLPRC